MNLIGEKFNKLTVISKAPARTKGKCYWNCKCDCGNFKVVKTSDLIRGKTKSCGCLVNRTRMFPAYDNLPSEIKRVLRTRYRSMLARCYNPKTNDFNIYGGKGITVCDEWKNSYKKFAAWALDSGFNPSLSIDREDPNGNYCPENCRWVTMKEQQNNRTNNSIYEYNGETKTISQLAEKYGINKNTLIWRLSKGMCIKDAIETPIDESRHQKTAIKREGLAKKCKEHGIRYQTVWQRMFLYGWSEEKALTTPVKNKK